MTSRKNWLFLLSACIVAYLVIVAGWAWVSFKAPNQFNPVRQKRAWAARVARVRALVHGQCRPSGWFDTALAQCARRWPDDVRGQLVAAAAASAVAAPAAVTATAISAVTPAAAVGTKATSAAAISPDAIGQRADEFRLVRTVSDGLDKLAVRLVQYGADRYHVGRGDHRLAQPPPGGVQQRPRFAALCAENIVFRRAVPGRARRDTQQQKTSPQITDALFFARDPRMMHEIDGAEQAYHPTFGGCCAVFRCVCLH
jgi:hypothetical protein